MAVVVLLQREDVLTLELGIPSHVGWKAGEVQLVWTVEPLVREPGLGQGGTVGFDPLVVRDARGQIVHHVQELELGGVYEHDATVLFRCKDLFVLGHERNIVLADELEVVVTRVEPNTGTWVNHYKITLLCAGVMPSVSGSLNLSTTSARIAS